MQIIKYHYHNVVETDFLLMGQVVSPHLIPRLKKIVISNGGSNGTDNYILSSLFILDYIGNQKPVILCKKNNLVGGGKVTLRKSMMFLFLFKLLAEILPYIKSFEGFKPPLHVNTFMFQLKDIFLFKGLTTMFPYLDNSACFIKIQVFTTSKTPPQLFQLGRSLVFCFPNL